MTTKIKILAGFTLMILLIAVLAVTSYWSTSGSADNFSSYRTLSRADVNLSNMMVHMENITLQVYRFLNDGEKKDMDEAKKEIANLEERTKTTIEILSGTPQQKQLESILTESQRLNGLAANLEKDLTAFYTTYKTVFLKGERELMSSLTLIAEKARDVGNSEALLTSFTLLDTLANVTSAMVSYSHTRSDEYLGIVKTNIQKLIEHGNRLGGQLTVGENLQVHATVMDGINNLAKLSSDMNKLANSVKESDAAISSGLSRVLADISAINDATTEKRRTSGAQIEESNQTSMRSAMIMGAVGLLLGCLFATVIVIGIIRALKELAAFAQAVSEGNFAYKIKSKEKGEVGTVVSALLGIPEVLNKIIADAGKLSDRVRQGDMRSRLQAAEFLGSYAELAVAVNTVCETYSGVIDSLPLPIMACDAKHKIVFLNSSGQSVLGGNLTGTACSDQLKASECKGEKCLGRQAMEKNTTVSAEVVIYPKGVKQIAIITVMPLHDNEGKVIGYFEVISDITEIRNQQQTMQRVANDALNIANRVAAASEELSSQVEQISRGAEMQRSRVESTASAMTQMNATVLEVARSASQASDQSEKAKDKANDGASLVNQVVHSINQINSVAVTLQTNMQELGDQAESIGGVMNVISDIADQTNLLALNAAIEAARAGEAGRGFAVVADEVRKLAEKTMSATHEVGSSIKAIQQSTRVNIDEVGNAVKSINEATELANSSGEALSEIVELSSANSNVVAAIATAAEEQSATSEEIHHAIDEINSIVGETTEGMIQSSAAVQDLSQMAQELNRTMEHLK